MKINIKYKNIIFVFMMAFSMSLFVSFMLVSINFGYSSKFLGTWLKMWSEAFVCAFIGAYFFPKIIQKVMKKITFIEAKVIENKTRDIA